MKKAGFVAALMASSALVLSGCGTLTGIPGHGGGKRFVEEQRLVSASIRGSLEAIDITPLRGKRVALIFSLISDEGGGNIVGGRASLSAILTGGTLVSPINTRSNALEIYELASAGTSQVNTTSAGSGTNTATVGVVQTNTSTSVAETAGPTTTTGSTTQVNPAVTTTTTTNSTPTTTTTATPSVTVTTTGTTGSNTTTTTGTTTTTSATTGTSSGSTTTPATTVTTTTTPGTSTTTQSTPSTTTTGTSTSTTTNPTVTTTTNGSGNSTQTTNGSNTSNSTTDSAGSTTGTREEVVVTGHTEQRRGHYEDASATLRYEGLGTYQNLAVPKSDASLLMSLTRNYFLLNEVQVTTPQDPTAEAIVYVTVDIFGTDRKRTDLVIYNNERLSAETSIEMFAANRAGKIIMRPRVGNIRTDYREDYILWAGPFDTQRSTDQGVGLMNDFTDQ